MTTTPLMKLPITRRNTVARMPATAVRRSGRASRWLPPGSALTFGPGSRIRMSPGPSTGDRVRGIPAEQNSEPAGRQRAVPFNGTMT